MAERRHCTSFLTHLIPYLQRKLGRPSIMWLQHKPWVQAAVEMAKIKVASHKRDMNIQ